MRLPPRPPDSPSTKEYMSNSKRSSSGFGTIGRLGSHQQVPRRDSHPPASPDSVKAASSAGWIFGSPEFDCRRELQLLSPNHVRCPVMFPEHLTVAGIRGQTRGPGARRRPPSAGRDRNHFIVQAGRLQMIDSRKARYRKKTGRDTRLRDHDPCFITARGPPRA